MPNAQYDKATLPAGQVVVGKVDYNYTFLYWLLFLFYSFQALDELTELYTVLAEREKGAIGLLFEMNYFLGIGVTIYSIWVVFRHGMGF